MWGIAPLDDLDTNTKYKILGRPQKIAMQYLWKWGELVKPMEVPKNLLRETVCISDFGAAFKAGTEMQQNVLPPLRYCAPERLHGADPSFAGDMWSYMCVFAELYLGVVPWRGYMMHRWMMNNMVRILGPFPEEWKGHYEIDGGVFKDSWYSQGRLADPSSAESALKICLKEEQPDTSPTERDHVLSVMSKGFCYLPEGRLTATQLLQDPSFKALMEIYGC
jgi:serine/threonine protein kinase